MQEFIRGSLPSVEFDWAVRLSDLTAERAGAADCALLDLSLPDASGLEALVAVRAAKAASAPAHAEIDASAAREAPARGDLLGATG